MAFQILDFSRFCAPPDFPRMGRFFGGIRGCK